MIEFCFETDNWSPFLGFEKPDPQRMIRAAAANGFTWISFDLHSLDYFIAQGGTLAALKESLSTHELKMLAIHFLRLTNDVDEVEAQSRTIVETCLALGARYVQAGATDPVDERVIEGTRRAGRICREAGVGLAVEYLPFLPVATIGQTRSLLEAAHVPGPNIVVDTWHFFNGPDDWRELDQLSAEEIAYIQFNDHGTLESTDLYEETVNRRLMPGEGVFDLERFASVIRTLGFDGVVCPEILSLATRDQPIEDVARRIMETSRPYWQAGPRSGFR
jgi:sugar phosphate isomerase/epimerase